MKKVIHTPNAPTAIGPYSQAILVNGFLYTSGQIALNPDSGELVMDTIELECHQVMKNLKAVLAAANMEFSHVVKTTIYLSDMNLYSKINMVYANYFDTNPPAREAVHVAGLPKGVNVEISMVASVV